MPHEEGVWVFSYSIHLEEPFADTGDERQQGVVVMQDGLIMGRDPHGGQYNGKYSVAGNQISLAVYVDAYKADFDSVLGVAVPYQLELKGEVNAPDHFSVTGSVVGADAPTIVITLRREF